MNRLPVFEEHGEVLAHWLSIGSQSVDRASELVCFDRHFDFKAIPGKKISRLLDCGGDPDKISSLNKILPFEDSDQSAYGYDNFVFAAASLGLLSRFVWVMPDSLANKAGVGPVLWERLSLIKDIGPQIIETFKVDAGIATTCFNGLTVQATTVENLPKIEFAGHPLLDVDLDYFADQDGSLEHPVSATMANMVRWFGKKSFISATHSITSGFLPEARRHLAADLAAVLDAKPQQSGSSRTTDRPTQRLRSVSALVEGRRLDVTDIDDLWIAELAGLANQGAAWSLKAILLASIAEPESAAEAWQQAQDQGDRAILAAHTIGKHYLTNKNYRQAADWFDRGLADYSDTFEVKNLFLKGLALYKDGNLKEARRIGLDMQDRFPMCLDAYTLSGATSNDISEASACKMRRMALKSRSEGCQVC